MRLIVLQNEAMITDIVSDREAVYIGSREGCRVHLPEGRIAPQQAVVYPHASGGWLIEQLDTRCEIRLNGMTVASRADLKTGDEVSLQDYTIRVYPEYEEVAPRAALGASRAALERFVQSKLPMGAILKRADEPLTVQPDQMDTLGRLGVSIGGCGAVEELMDTALSVLLSSFAAHRVWIGVRRVSYGPFEYEEGRFLTGQPADLPALARDFKPRVLDRGQFVLLPVISREEPVSVLCGPLLGPDGALGLVYIDSGDTGRRFDVRDLDYLVLHLNTIAYQLEAIFKTIARTRAAMIDGQVTVAHDVQTRLTPRKLPQSDALQCGAFREPGRERAGDIYDVLRLSNGQVAVMVAHTATAGSLPAILMTQAVTTFRYACMHQDTPSMFLRSLNWMLYDGQKDHPLECCAAILDPATGQLRYAMGGHLGAFIIGARGEERRLGNSEEIPPLGAARNTAFPLLPEQLEPGETLVLFTPGVTTAKNRKEETFGEERFVNILCDGFGQPASSMLKDMLTDLRNFTEAGQQPDDITVILAHRV
ncbi:MAG: SpoIIE family protein phosphatase [Planctomycetota bacterium]